jgi:hypothetical protein|eukprot:COSAG06_NODE_6169_length_3071_cov_1.593203_4_plen_68_part_00
MVQSQNTAKYYLILYASKALMQRALQRWRREAESARSTARLRRHLVRCMACHPPPPCTVYHLPLGHV